MQHSLDEAQQIIIYTPDTKLLSKNALEGRSVNYFVLKRTL